MKLSKIISAFFAVLFCMNLVSVSVFAESGKWNDDTVAYTKFWADNDECNYVPSGGINKLGGIPATSREETQELESYLKSIGYILATTENKQISDEDVEMLKDFHFCGIKYLDSSDSFYWSYDNFRVYVYQPTFDTIKRQYKEKGKAELFASIELSASTVVIDYYYWQAMERIGTTVDAIDEINNNIPERLQENAGFVKFITPIDCEIILYLYDANYYYRLFLRKGTTLMKMHSEHYQIEFINAVGMDVGDELLTNKNYIVVYQQPEDDPLIVDITQAVKRDMIEGIDIKGQPDYGWVFEPADIHDIGDVTVEHKPEKNEKDVKTEGRKWKFPIIAVIILAIAGIIVWIKHKKGD